MRSLVVLLILFSLSLVNSSTDSGSLIDLEDGDEFFKLIEKTKNKLVFVRFHYDSCPACEWFRPYWEKMAETLKDECVVVDFECSENMDVCNYVGIIGFPDFAVFDKNRLIAIYSHDDYNYGKLVRFIRKQKYLQEPFTSYAKSFSRVSYGSPFAPRNDKY